MAIFALITAVLLLAADQLTKFLAVKYLSATGPVVVLEGVLNLSLVENRGAAFGIMQGGRWFFVALTSVILVFIIFYYRTLPKTKTAAWSRLALVLISAGAAGNFLDRLANGFVIDFLHVRFINFPVFNLADIYVVSGTCLLAVITLFFTKGDKPREEPSRGGLAK